MTKKKFAILAVSSMGVFMAAALTVGVIYKMNKVAEYEEYLAQQQQVELLEREAAQKAAEQASQERIKETAERYEAELQKQEQLKPKKKEPVSSVPQVTVEVDAQGNQTITPDFSKPAPPTHEELHDPTSKPETPKRPTPNPSDKPSKPTEPPKQPDQPAKDTQPDIKFDANGDQIPNENGELYDPVFGWLKPSGGVSEEIDNTGWEDSPQIGH